MKFKFALIISIVGLFASNALAQSAAPASPATTTGATASGSKTPSMDKNSMDKKAISAKCSQEATAKGLHGKARKHFRSLCKAGKA